VLSPYFVGRRVNLNPVWIMFALFAFGYVFGFVGLLIAVPLAAAIGVLARFALRRYYESSLYAAIPAASVTDADRMTLGDKKLDCHRLRELRTFRWEQMDGSALPILRRTEV
jgi:hypothetical protein